MASGLRSMALEESSWFKFARTITDLQLHSKRLRPEVHASRATESTVLHRPELEGR